MRYAIITMLTTVLMLASASVVGAEQGWVLWVHKTHQDSSKWELEGASDSLGGCEKVKREAWKSMVEKYEDESIYPEVEDADKNPYDRVAVRVKPKRESEPMRYVHTCLEDGIKMPCPKPTEDEKRIAQRKDRARRTTTYRFLCLPDTIDPREKKED